MKTTTKSKYMKFWEQNPNYTALVHVVLGIGLGVLGQTYVVAGYTNMLGWFLVFLGVVGHLYPLVA